MSKASNETVINLDTASHVERLIASGVHPERARVVALSSAARAIAASLKSPPSEVAQLADRVRSGDATIVQLADRIQRDERCDRDAAFDKASRIVRGSRDPVSLKGADQPRMSAVPLDASALMNDDQGRPLTIVQLADKIQREQRCDRDTAFDRAGRMLRG